MLDPLTHHYAGLGIQPVFLYCRDATDPMVPQWELPALSFPTFTLSVLIMFGGPQEVN